MSAMMYVECLVTTWQAELVGGHVIVKLSVGWGMGRKSGCPDSATLQFSPVQSVCCAVLCWARPPCPQAPQSSGLGGSANAQAAPPGPGHSAKFL